MRFAPANSTSWLVSPSSCRQMKIDSAMMPKHARWGRRPPSLGEGRAPSPESRRTLSRTPPRREGPGFHVLTSAAAGSTLRLAFDTSVAYIPSRWVGHLTAPHIADRPRPPPITHRKQVLHAHALTHLRDGGSVLLVGLAAGSLVLTAAGCGPGSDSSGGASAASHGDLTEAQQACVDRGAQLPRPPGNDRWPSRGRGLAPL